MTTPGTTPTRDSSGIGATTREMWATRPVRDPDDKVIAGVAAALARRYAIDPTLVRVVFVVSAFYGVGLLLYFVGWLVLPDRARPGRTPVLVAVVVAILAVVSLGGLFRGTSPVLIGLLLAAALLYALHVNRADLGTSDVVRDGDGTTTALASGPAAGAAAPPPRAPRPPRSPLTPITLAAALVVAGLVLAAGLAGWVPLGVTSVVGAALAVVAVGLIVGAFLRSGRWLILAAVPLALVLVGAANVPPWHEFARSGFGPRDDGVSRAVDDASWAPRDAATVAPAYRTGIGDLRLDLRALPPGPPVTTTVESGVGDVTVLVGPTADVTVDCASGAGDVRCLGRTTPGRVVDLGVDGPGGPVITLRAQTGAGDLEVTRG